MKELLITSGYPRSGSTYLNQALNLLYYPEQKANKNKHTVIAIEESNRIMVTFRNPLESISSWQAYPLYSEIDEDVRYYSRFYKGVLKNIHKVVLMDFDVFTKNIDYIKDKVFKNFGINTNRYITDIEVKETMLANNKQLNLPRGNEEELAAIRQQLTDFPGFSECVELYQQIKSLA